MAKILKERIGTVVRLEPYTDLQDHVVLDSGVPCIYAYKGETKVGDVYYEETNYGPDGWGIVEDSYFVTEADQPEQWV